MIEAMEHTMRYTGFYRIVSFETADNLLQDFLRIAEIAGPATSIESTPVQLPPTGRVELKRRRVTKDGRVRLKLTLMDIVVDKCGICLSKFKEAEVACHGTTCRHTYACSTAHLILC